MAPDRVLQTLGLRDVRNTVARLVWGEVATSWSGMIGHQEDEAEEEHAHTHTHTHTHMAEERERGREWWEEATGKERQKQKSSADVVGVA